MQRIFIVLLALNGVYSWNTCSDEEFCDRIRNEDITSSLALNWTSLSIGEYVVTADLESATDDRKFTLSVSAVESETFRITIDDPSTPRHAVPEALKGELVNVPINVTNTSESVQVSVGDSQAWIEFSPFKISIYKDDRLVLIINDEDRLTFNSEEDDQAVALDFTFPGAVTAYGIPEHAERLSLQSTGLGGLNPYRMYNVDNPGFGIGTQEALYGSVPVLYAHGTDASAGIFWLNSAQTFVDINRESDRLQSLFISEYGMIDIFVLTGPTLDAAVKQYTNLTGTTPLPQYFTLGHHQSRWSYLTQEDAETVIREFDNHDFPLDVIWFDIDYTDGKKYFTWNYTAFPDPVGMQRFINSTGRKAVLIIDPHYKVEDGYFVYETAKANDYFVKNPDGTDYQASCWPGLSSWMDFLKPEAAAYYSSLFGMDNFTDATDIVYIWNDMNEPAVFDVEEKTMPSYLIHNGNILHGEIHNMYGFSQTVATFNGLLARYDNKKRPFVLTRAHFAGNQRYSAVWTGDNLASWEHLRISFPMCLTLALSGISFCGADVGGFSQEVTEELFQRWYQAGAWLPFYRAHSEEAVERREPYLFAPDVQTRFRNAMRQRYYYLPLWYTLFYEHERFEDPVIRPISYHYQSDVNTIDMDDQWLVGRDVMVHPVATEGATEVQVYFPGGANELWFDIDNNLLYFGVGYLTVPVTMDSVPVYHRGGSILSRKETHRPSSAATIFDPYTVYVFADSNDQATGTLYIDDNESFDYRSNVYNYYRITYNSSGVVFYKIDTDASYDDVVIVVSRLLIYRPPSNYKEAVMNGGRKYQVTYSDDDIYLVVDLNVSVQERISIEFK